MNPTPPVNGAVRMRPGRRQSLHQVLSLQQITHEAVRSLAGDFNGTSDKEERTRAALAIASLGKSWVSLQDAKREILGRPRMGMLRFERKHAKGDRQRGGIIDVQAVARLMESEQAEKSVG